VNPFIFNTAKSIQFGAGAVKQLGEIVKADFGTRVLLVTDPGMIATGLVEHALMSLKEVGVTVEMFSDVQADPPEHVILSAAEHAKRTKVDAIVGFGGGSSLDVAKLVALLACGDETLAAAYGI
jgi:alcohol dehydrogenase class IV